LQAIQKTINELEGEFVTVQQKTKDDIMENLKADLPVLGYKPRGVLLLEGTPSFDIKV
jgi:hypothetical protein